MPGEPDQPPPSSFMKALHRFGELLGLDRPPDSAEDLEQEIQELLDEGKEHGLISDQEGKMINSIFDFRDTEAREIMTPASEVVSAPESCSLLDCIRLIIDRGYSRIPVYADTPDAVTGIVHAKDLLSYALACDQPTPALTQYAKPAVFVSEETSILKLLLEFQTKKHHMAIVKDEFGGVRGLVTLEDILEEIVGEIADEYDTVRSEMRRMDQDTILVQAKIDLEEVEEFFHVTLPPGSYESIGGFLLHHFGRVPGQGEEFTWEDLHFKVLSASSRRIKFVKINRVLQTGAS